MESTARTDANPAHITVSPYLERELLPMTPGVRLQIRAYRIFRQRFATSAMSRISAEAAHAATTP